MSRASKGFADFFPTAPSVLQQKRSRTVQNRKKQKPSVVDEPAPTHASSKSAPISTSDLEPDTEHLRNRTRGDHGIAEPLLRNQEDNESPHGDQLNGVGSRSSSSTTSSVFSNNHRSAGPSCSNGGNLITSLTPLTNTDSSPPGTNKSPPIYTTHSLQSGIDGYIPAESVTNIAMEHTPAALTPVSSPGLVPTQARPGKGEAKGTKLVYDPELDKKISAKDRKGRKVQYNTFGEEVCFLQDKTTAHCSGYSVRLMTLAHYFNL